MKDSIGEFYDRYPYPQVDKVECDLNLLDHMHYLSHTCFDHGGSRRSGQGGRMLVAGCGTREAVGWALGCPQWRIDAVDVSDASIAISRKLAEQLDVADRINFRHTDFEQGQGLDGPYDFISSSGVLHHLASPQRGLAQLEKHLAANGVMALMVYSHTNRSNHQHAQRVLGLLTRDIDDAQEAEQAALEICRTGSKTANRLSQTFKCAVDQYEHDRPQFADTMLNPRETSYSIWQLVEFLATAGLDLVSPVMPILWCPQQCLGPEAYERYLKLPMLEQLDVADRLKSPLFWVLAKRKRENTHKRCCEENDDLFWQIVPMAKALSVHPVDKLVVKSAIKWDIPIKRGEKDGVVIHSYSSWASFHRIGRDLLELVDGQRTLEQIGHTAAQMNGVPFDEIKETVKRYFHRLIDEMLLATPDVTQCHACPLRQAAMAEPKAA